MKRKTKQKIISNKKIDGKKIVQDLSIENEYRKWIQPQHKPNRT